MAVVAAIIATAILLQFASVQTALLQRAEAKYLSELDADISFSKVHFRPFNTIVVRDLVIVDRCPEMPSEEAMEIFRNELGADYEYEPYDTLMKAGYLEARFSLAGLMKKEGVHISKALVKDGRINLVVEERGLLTNLQRMFGMEKSDGEPKDNQNEVFTLSHARLRNMEFSMQIIRAKHPAWKGGINWCDLHTSEINADAKNLKMSRGILSGTLENCSFREKSGLEVQNISANTAVGRGQAMVENIRLRTPDSEAFVKYFSMSFRKPKDFRDFNALVRLDGKLINSRLSTATLGYFVPALSGMDILASAHGEIHGTVDSFDLKGLELSTLDNDFRTTLEGNVSGITRDDPLVIDLHASNCRTSTKGLEGLLKGITGSDAFFKGKAPDLKGTADIRLSGPLDNLCMRAGLDTDAGHLEADMDVANLTLADSLMRIAAQIETKDLDISRLIGKNLVHECSMKTTVHATLRGEEGPQLKIDTLSIGRLNINRYDYSRILATGELSKKRFNGRIISQDPNFNFLFQGIFTFSPKTQNALYQFYANLGHADLHALNIDQRENSTLSLRTDANFNRTGKGLLLGCINVKDLRLGYENEVHNIGDAIISSRSADDEYRINMVSGFAEASYRGSGSIADFYRDLVGLTAGRELPALIPQDDGWEWSGNSYDLSLNCVDMRDITAFLKPGLYIDNNTSVKLSIDSDGKMGATLNSRRLAIRDKYIKDLEMTLDNEGDRVSGQLNSSDIRISALQLIDNGISLLADDNRLGVGFVCKGDRGSATSGEIYARSELSRGEDGKLRMRAEVLPSGFNFNGDQWSIMPSGIDLDGSDIGFRDLRLSSGEQEITVNGTLSAEHPDTLSLKLDAFSLGIANAFTSKAYDIRGDVTGEALVLSYGDGGRKGLLLDMVSDSTSFAGTPLGSVRLHSDWDDSFRRFDIKASNGSSFDAAGTYTPSLKDTDMKLCLRGFDIGVARPFLAGVFSDMSGNISADVTLSGPVENLSIKSSGGRIEDAVLRVDYTDVPYRANGPFHIDEYGLYFDDVAIRDFSRGHGTVNGKVGFDHFRDLNLDLAIKAENALLTNISEKKNDGFYGKLTGNATLGIKGPLDKIALTIDAATTGASDFHIPTAASAKGSSSDLLTFTQRQKVVVIDPYEEMMSKLEDSSKSRNDLSIKVRAVATQDVEAFLEIDKSSGNGLIGRGNGVFDIDVRPSRGLLSIKGDYALTSGTFTFNAFGLAKREFEITEGSNIKLNGEIKDTDLDIEAIYRTKASIARLISDTSSVNTRRLVECGINIGDKLSNPTLNFAIDIPDLEPSIKSKVENALSTEDKVQKQFIALLVYNNFLPDEQSGITNDTGTGLIYSSVTSVFSNQLNNILQKLDIPLDFDMSYQQNQRGNDIFDFAVSTQLFHNRVVVNGNIGNRQYNTGNSNSDVVGDLDIEIKLDKAGAFRLNLFSHSADQYTNYLDNSQRNGIGVTYQQEFNKLKDMLRYMFAGKKKKEALAAEEEEKASSGPKKVMSVDKDGTLKVMLNGK